MNKRQLELPLFEQWLPIDGYEDLYQVSNFGRVKSLNYNHTNQERILKQVTDNKGYQRIGLSKDGKQKWFRIHRLVANAFIDNPNNYEQVNHIDENKCNNHVSNLEWCTAEYNINYGNRTEKASSTNSGENNPMYGKHGEDNHLSKQVIQLTLDGEVIRNWGGTREIERKLGYHSSSISACCRGKRKSAHRYKWQYA